MIEYWFMFPIGIIIATIAMMAGIGGAILFSPFLILVLKLEPITAIATGLAIEMFGFSSGIIGYLRKRLIDFHIVKEVVAYSVSATIVGIIIARYVHEGILKLIITALILVLAYKFLVKTKTKTKIVKTMDFTAKSIITTGGLLIGLISSGLGELNEYLFLNRMKLPTARASATSVFLVAMSAIAGVIAHIIFIAKEGTANVDQALAIIIFAVPGVIIGAQIGVYAAQRTKRKHMQNFLGLLFAFIGIIMLVSLF